MGRLDVFGRVAPTALADLNHRGSGIERLEHHLNPDLAAVARRLGDHVIEAGTMISSGTALAELRRFEEAITACQDAATIYRETDDRHSEGMVLNNLAILWIGDPLDR